jgi:hypothetical protein
MKKEKIEMVVRCQRRKKLFAVEQFGGKCQICGYNKCIDALEFHHIDEKTKEESPSYIIMRWSWKRVKLELDKCVLLCANCHREVHHKICNIDLKRLTMPWIDIKCNCCHKIFSTKVIGQLYCSNGCRGYVDRKIEHPSKEQLKALLDQKTPWTQIGRMFSVSDNAVRKWAKKYDLLNAIGTRAAE